MYSSEEVVEKVKSNDIPILYLVYYILFKDIKIRTNCVMPFLENRHLP